MEDKYIGRRFKWYSQDRSGWYCTVLGYDPQLGYTLKTTTGAILLWSSARMEHEAKRLYWLDKIKPKTPAATDDKWNTTCKKCGSPAYLGMHQITCSNCG